MGAAETEGGLGCPNVACPLNGLNGLYISRDISKKA